ncbi:PilZ domain-containing protein [Domibacillus robiginosus]|uniref:PilZ domain-containing protein n=1 Tax=Domibacillus robiginosus TaxID=1071054 RepID=UPI00067D1807|nr:PilZ domain-containing protein [Domibacillus robiginosus]
MYYKRQEAFRYAFSESIPAVCEVFEFIGPDERKKVQSFDAFILDLSPTGLKAASKEAIDPAAGQLLIFTFQLAGTHISFPGKIIRQRYAGTVYHYGVQNDGNEALKNQIIDSLKKYTKEQLKKSKR